MTTLTDSQFARAVAANPRWKARLATAWPSDAQFGAAGLRVLSTAPDHSFAEAIAAFQAMAGLDVDGICGTDTAARVRGAPAPRPAGRPILIVGGEEVPAPGCRVVTWKSPDGMGFQDQSSWRPRQSGTSIDLLVLHHDGCRSSRQCFDVLIQRGLSVHLMLDRDGTIYQALDLRDAHAFHAGEVNARSVGVEICNPELPERNDTLRPRPVVTLEVTNAGGNGARRQVLGFYPEQVTAAIALAKAVAGIFRFPLRLPVATSPTSSAGVTRGVDRRVSTGGYSGVCGHYHVKDTKTDPGVSLWSPMRNAGIEVG
jgi:hypothetical protein